MDKHIFGECSRVFLNTELGCASSCSYCYLPSEGYFVGKASAQASRLGAHEILTALAADPRILWGTDGTIFSIGCFSECWDRRNRTETIKLIQGLLPKLNKVQLATKRRIAKEDLEKITTSSGWRNQLAVFVSSATISEWTKYERGTTHPVKRFQTLEACQSFGIAAYLYIKPVIPGVTISDANLYASLMERYKVGAIVGDRFTENTSGNRSPISKKLGIIENIDVAMLRKILSRHGAVFKNSTDALQ
jgi:DNA repair photolyase